jgi:hypothetical protein
MGWRKKPVEQRQRPDANRPGAPVYSYYNAPSPNRPNQDKIVDLSVSSRRRVRLLPTIIAICVIVLSLLLSLTLSSTPYVTTSDGSESPYRSHVEYEAEAARFLSTSANNKTKFTISTADAERHMLETFPELRAVALRLPIIGRRLNLILELRKPTLVLTTPGKSFVLDETGRAVTELQDLAIDARKDLVVLKDQSGLVVETGKQAITSDTILFIKTIIAQLDAQSLKSSELTLPPAANQLDIRLQDVSYYIKTDVAGNARLQIGSFLAVKERLEREGVTPAEYIDVRVEEKVFYK